ncbi:MAG: transglycosylase SLT domain-containing protein [Proteobacteria bacterium]|nr:transglycosylase SLT domain-containing protein [Pseudomonadota bacterium]
MHFHTVIRHILKSQRFGLTLFSLVVLTFFGNPLMAAEDELFPTYPSITGNIDFWKKIYSRYTTQQGVIHDTDNVNIVYAVLDLKPRNKRSSRRQNSKLIRKTIRKYSDMLGRLAKGIGPANEEEARVAKMFGEKPDPLVLLEAKERIRFQRGQADRFKKGIIRSGRYLPKIKEIFKEAGLPEDLAYLPHVESSFNYNAYSKFGAAGIWQFTYSTGKRFMTINYTVDERRDPIIAAYAAAKMLKSDYKKLGNWPLAITAYNHGVNSMLRAKKENGDYETIFNNYEGRRFKFASKNFYSEFLAALDVAKFSETYFGPLQLDKPFPAKVIKMPGYVSVKKIARHFKTDINSIRYLNPALRRPVFQDQKYIPKGYQLRLPMNKEIETLAINMPADIFEKKQKRSRFYYVRKGDVAGSIARKHGITVQELIWANNLNRRATIYVGQNLRIPTKEDSILLAAKHAKKVASTLTEKKKEKVSNGDRSFPKVEMMENGEAKLSSNVNLSVVTGNLTVKSVFEKKGKSYGVIRVDTGETLGHYAEWLEVSTQSIRRINRFRYGRMIEFNDRVIIPLDKVSRESFEEKRYEYHKEFEEDFLSAYSIDSVIVYEIKRGDNIWNLCQNEFELPFWLIRKYNQDLDFNKLKPFQKIIVPVVDKSHVTGL